MKITDLSQLIVQYPVEMEFDTPAGAQKLAFTGHFRVFDDTETQRVLQDGDDTDIIKTVLIGWDGIEDDEGTRLPFNDSTLTLLLQRAVVRVAIIRAFMAMNEDQIAKNLKRRSPNG